MFFDVLAAGGLLVCLLWLVHGWLPAARRQRVNAWLRRANQGLRNVPAEWRSRRGGRQARRAAQSLIERSRRQAPVGQVHDLERFRQQRQTAARGQGPGPNPGAEAHPEADPARNLNQDAGPGDPPKRLH